MNISMEKTGDLTATIKIEIPASDYLTKTEKSLREMARKANVPGFRPGKVPFGMVKKMYGKSVMFDEINTLVSESLENYIKDNQLDIFGHPLPNKEKKTALDLETETDLEFYFDLGIKPEINLTLDNSIQVKEYHIQISDQDTDDYINELRRNYGTYGDVDVAGEEDMIFGEFNELDTKGTIKEGGKHSHSPIVPKYIVSKTQKKKFLGAKPGDVIDFDLFDAFQNDNEIARILKCKPEELQDVNKKFRFQVEKVQNIIPAELNEEFYKKTVGDRGITDEESYKKIVSESLLNHYKNDSVDRLRHDIRKQLLEKANISLPVDFLRRLIIENDDEEKISEEQLNAQLPSYLESVKWQLIENHLAAKYHIHVEKEDLNAYFASAMGLTWNDEADERTKQLVEYLYENTSKDKDRMRNVYDIVFDNKMLQLFRDTISIVPTEITFKEFANLAY